MTHRNHEEDDLQIAAMKFIWLQYPHLLAWHTPNGGKRGKREAARLKRMGVLAGVPDITILFGLYQVAFIELKAAKGRQTEGQKDFEQYCRDNNYTYVICRTLGEVQTAMARITRERDA